ncbi:hypothetical protein [Pseudomonas sp. N040]|uniref:hypothetical protein n=1 Tax=Pseudomonas sp. N040 TaxID=2785325 RepID=UPI0018A265CE|nr:hypothetical protein [Pseudomonas sp. N040]MBF7729212.1 hypothetical protein [Pseudomonas sp. N040]MBW7012852.1 hypothetical protein [Pseudomonas sp. N040]
MVMIFSATLQLLQNPLYPSSAVGQMRKLNMQRFSLKEMKADVCVARLPLEK